MNFLNENAADILQQIAIFIELTGFILIVIEIYFPKTADSIEAFIDETARQDISLKTFKTKRVKLSVLILALIFLAVLRVAIPKYFESLLHFTGGWLQLSGIFIIGAFFSYHIVMSFFKGEQKQSVHQRVFWLFIVPTSILWGVSLYYLTRESFLFFYVNFARFLFIIVPLWIFFVTLPLQYILTVKLISYSLIQLNRIAKGRALGAFGLVLSSVGLLFETYQVLVLWLGKNA